MINLAASVSCRPFLTICSALALLFFVPLLSAASVAFDIAPQTAPAALDLFIKQSGAQVVYLQDDVKDARTNALSGSFEPKAALEVLLKDTGLRLTEGKAGQFTVGRIGPKPGSVEGTLVPSRSGGSLSGVTITVLETGARVRVGEGGIFRFPSVPPGTYTLAAAGEGFSRLRITDVVVRAGAETALGQQEMPVSLHKSDVQTMEEVIVSAKNDIETLAAIEVASDRLKPFITNNVDLPRSIDDIQPYYVWFSNKIETTGATDVQDFFKKMVPMDANRTSTQQLPTGQSFSNISLGGFDGGSGLNTAQNTLVLVDGLPLPNTSYSTRTYGPNLSSIPVGAIDHIEVMPASGSAIYGASAVGGVVNIVMKHEYNGAELSMTYDNTFDSDAPKRSANLSYGRTLEGGKTKLLLTANWSTEKPLTVQDRFSKIVGPYQARYFGNYPGGQLAYIGLATAAGAITAPSAVYLNQPIIASVNGSPLFAGNPASVVQVPVGYQSFQANGIAPLQANLGKFDLSIPNTNTTVGMTGLKMPLTQGYANKALSLGLRRQMTGWLELYAQAGTQTNASPQFTSYSQFSSVTVPANAPGNPFGQAVKVSGVQQGMGLPGIAYNTVTHGASAGARMSLPHEWKADLNYTWGLTAVSSYGFGLLDATAIAAAAANGSLNLITDVSRYPFNASAYPAVSVMSQRTSANTALLKAVGPLMKLWAGAPTLAIGVEHQKNGGKGGNQYLNNTASGTVVGVAPTATLTQIVYWPGGSTVDNSAYAELSVPLVRKTNQIPLVRQFDVQLAGRYDDYVQTMTSPVQNITSKQVGGATTYSPALLNGTAQPFTLGKGTRQKTNETVGFKYKPVESVFFRWSYSTAFIPPIYSQVVTPISTGTITQTTGAYPGVPTTAPWAYTSITDTLLGNAVYSVPTKSGGNPNLKPETSKGMNWGVVFEPTFLRGLRVSLDYVKITKHDAIITPTAATLIPNADAFPGRVTRGTPNAGQTVGPIVLLDTTNINAPEISTSSYNLKADYTLRTNALGRFDFSTVASSWQHYKQQTTIGGAVVEQLNNPNTTVVGASQSLALAKFKGTLGVDWSKGPFTAGWMTRYVSPYTLGSRFGIGGTFPTQGTVNGWVSSQIYHDVYFGVKLGKETREASLWRRSLSDTSVQLGVRNIFNKAPPFDALGGVSPYFYSTYGDARLASYYLTVKRAF